MAYLHCHNCNFSQDDYWHKTYNPITCFQNDLEDLLEKDLDEIVEMDSEWMKKKENGYKDYKQITRRKLVLYHLWQIKNRIEKMIYRNPEELKKKNPEMKCPICKQKTLDVD